jgi:hypothetical protein
LEPALQLLSIELTNRCNKGCAFCYNASSVDGGTHWHNDELRLLLEDCARHGVKAVSFGGGEPLQYDGVHDLIAALHGTLFRSLTTNGLLLDDAALDRLVAAKIDKVHVSIHAPERDVEVRRVLAQVQALAARGIRSGVNLLVDGAKLEASARAAAALRRGGIGNERIVYLPRRGPGAATPSPQEMARVAGGEKFQSMSCLSQCAASPRFATIDWQKQVAHCSYTLSRRPLPELSWRGVVNALAGLGLRYCGDGVVGDLQRIGRPKAREVAHG